MNLMDIMRDEDTKEAFLKDAEQLRELFLTEHWKIFQGYMEALYKQQGHNLDRMDPDKPGIVGRVQGTRTALANVIGFEQVINDHIKNIRAAEAPLESEEPNE